MKGVISSWSPTSGLEERLKGFLIPPALYIRMRAAKEWRRGERELRLLPLLVDPRRDAVDVGANKGVWTWFLARMVPVVYAFEPNPKAFAVLRRGAAANVVCQSVALSDSSGTASLNVPEGTKGYSNQGSTLRALPEGRRHASLVVETARLDDLELQDVGFVKIDVEGHESRVLEGARETLARCRPVLVVEMEEKHTGRPVEKQVEEVEALGYVCLVLHHGLLKPFRAPSVGVVHDRQESQDTYIFNFIFLPA